MKFSKIGFFFAGQGSQTPGMGRDLANISSAAQKIFKRADETSVRSISALCFDSSIEELTACANCQPAIYTMSMACLAALQEQIPNFQPVACAGLSLGEYAALATAGVFDFDTGLRIVMKRGELMDEACRTTSGAMAAVLRKDSDFVIEFCRQRDIDVANFNSPEQQIISGASDKIAKAIAELSASGALVKQLTVAGAYHSRLMARAAEKFGLFLKNFQVRTPAIPIYQNFTGTTETSPELIKENLIRQISGSVQWDACARRMMANCDAIIELGPGKVLSGLAKRINREFPIFNINDANSLEETVKSIAEL